MSAELSCLPGGRAARERFARLDTLFLERWHDAPVTRR